jgi:antitoxin HicB
MQRYTVILGYNEDDGYIVSVPALPGCLTQGATVEQALARVRDAITGHIAALIDTGQPVPVETTAPIIAAVDVMDVKDERSTVLQPQISSS